MELWEKNKLLHARAAFGSALPAFERPLPMQDVVKELFAVKEFEALQVVSEQEWMAYDPKAMKAAGETAKLREMKQEFKSKTIDLNLMWLKQMVETSYPLLEKTALFWHGHFATRNDNPYFDQLLLHELRKNALGNFGDMLRAVSKSPAMLQFLNNRQNKKSHPNENFAREVMELFTMGRGHYTEDDVKEAARAFTGWNFDETGSFVFRERQHDAEPKKFLGKKGNFNGDNILDIILEQKQTALFITQKIYRYFVSDEKVNDKHVTELAGRFYESNYDIASLLRDIFSADWFYSSTTVGAKIKSPIELLTGYRRLIPMYFMNDRTLVYLQRVLGQLLFYPPNVAGWPGGKSWIDSASLATRMRLPEALLGARELDLSMKDDGDMMANHKTGSGDYSVRRNFRTGNMMVNWDTYLGFWKKYPKDNLPDSLASFLLPVSIGTKQLQEVDGFADKASDESYIKSLTILLMALPEYQLA